MTIHYVICSTQRSGSTLFCHLLTQTGVLGIPGELFGKPDILAGFAQRFGLQLPQDMDQLAARIVGVRRSRNDVFGFKAHWHIFERAQADFSFEERLPDLRYVHLARRDTVMQAVSLARARASNQFSAAAAASQEPLYDREAIQSAMMALAGEKAGWEGFFFARKIAPLRLTYEDVVADPQRSVSAVAEYLGVAAPPPVSIARTPDRQMRDRVSEQWAERFTLGR